MTEGHGVSCVSLRKENPVTFFFGIREEVLLITELGSDIGLSDAVDLSILRFKGGKETTSA